MMSAADPAKQAQKRWAAREVLMFPMLVSAMNDSIEPGSSYLEQYREEIERRKNGTESISQTGNEDR